MTLRSAGFALLLTRALAASAAPSAVEQPAAEPRRVLIISSFGNRFAPLDSFASTLRTEIARRWPGPVEFLEAPLEMARFAQPAEGAAFAEYLAALTTHSRLDLVVTVAGPAASFVVRHRERLFPSTPFLVTGLDERVVRELPPSGNQIVVAIHIDPSEIVEGILRLLPGTERVAVVLGDSPLERFWRVQLEREFAAFSGRVAFLWLNRLSLADMRREVAELPPGSAVLYGILMVDAAGVPHEDSEGLTAIRSASNSPVFGLYESQLGKGIVGGPLISVDREARRSAAVAAAMLRGTSAAQITVPPREPTLDLYDWRELKRWSIPEMRLPAGSEVRYRPPSVWEAYRKQALTTLGVVAVEAALIVTLLAQRRRRRRAEEHVRALNRRLITAQEDERKSIARELHDDLSQRLARLSIDAAQLEGGRSPAGAGAAAEIRGELTRLSQDVHALAYRLHPSTLDDLGLTEALRIECDRVSSLESLPVRLRAADTLPQLSRDGALCLFRVAQEGLHNVVRHARATAVDLTLSASDGGIRMTIRDDGAGFDPSSSGSRRGLGLASMRERVELAGGRIDIASAPGRGTTIDVWAPREGTRT